MVTQFSPHRLFESLKKWLDVDMLEVLPLLTVLLLLTTAPDVWYLRTPLLLMCTAGLVFRQILRTPHFWYITATLIGTTIYLNWESTDNHKYMVCYWCLALCTSLSLPPAVQSEALRTTSRWLLGLCMVIATLWKVGTPGYMNGDFFQFTLLIDDRFEYLTRWVGGATATILADNRELKSLLSEGYLRGLSVNAVQLMYSSGVIALAQFMTWWTIIIEGLAGILFLLPDKKWTSWLRNSVLLVFAVTTYAVATVRGFGWMLMMLGLAQTRDDQRLFRFSYVAVFLLIQIYTLPIAPVIERMGDAVFPKSNHCCPTEDLGLQLERHGTTERAHFSAQNSSSSFNLSRNLD